MHDPKESSPRPSRRQFVLTLSCRDQPGIVGTVGMFLAQRQCNIIDSAQYGDLDTGTFMMRVLFESLAGKDDNAALSAAFSPVGDRFSMQWRIHDDTHRPRVLIMVSKLDHCLNDLLYRYRAGALKIQPVAIVSNHRDTQQLSESHGIPFVYLPLTPENKQQQESELKNIIRDNQVELIVLARYMQILSADICRELEGKVINIHHSFLPGFKGARPYHQAYERGVKIIGATAHYVTADLDEGPIIEQDVARVDYKMSADDLVVLGRDVECLVLARAVKYHIEHRVFLNGRKTVVFH